MSPPTCYPKPKPTGNSICRVCRHQKCLHSIDNFTATHLSICRVCRHEKYLHSIDNFTATHLIHDTRENKVIFVSKTFYKWHHLFCLHNLAIMQVRRYQIVIFSYEFFMATHPTTSRIKISKVIMNHGGII